MAEEVKVTPFSKPDIIDGIIKARLATFPVKGGKTSSKSTTWLEEELELMDSVILEYITAQGLSREKTAQQIAERWGVSIRTARRYVSESIKRFAESNSSSEHSRELWLERCESILQDAIESRQKDTALKALDLLAKSMGLYKETKDINVSGDGSIKFDFD